MSDFNPKEIEAIGFDLDNTLLDRNQAVHGWLGSVLGDQPDVLAEATKMEQQYFAQITSAIQAENEEASKSKMQEETNEGQEEKQSQACKKIVEHFN